eukprot:TRINITY_DN14754_c0_g1_i1.p2 TRINITY_DN14754_c0_g1~~TRINITY_DN14754_c0_g1_i1.p2  ORF type:complete len:115 (-),score=18.43 TRINITY_DN14754_c0_g1_i1:160-504(-)
MLSNSSKRLCRDQDGMWEFRKADHKLVAVFPTVSSKHSEAHQHLKVPPADRRKTHRVSKKKSRASSKRATSKKAKLNNSSLDTPQDICIPGLSHMKTRSTRHVVREKAFTRGHF